MTITTENKNKPAAPTDLTEETGSTPSAPSNLTEEAASSPSAPVNLTEESGSTPVAPTDLTEIAKSDPLAPSNLTELSGSSPLEPNVVYSILENRVFYSEQFNNAVWLKSNLSVIDNNFANPLTGTNTASLVTLNTGTFTPSLNDAFTVEAGKTYTFSIYVRPSSNPIIQFLFGSGQTTGSNPRINFNISANTITAVDFGLTGTIEPIADSNAFRRISVTFVATGTLIQIFTAFVPSPTATRNQAGTWAGEVVYLFGAQLNEGTLSSYLPTTAVARVGNNPIAPSNLTEQALSNPLAPVNLTEIASAGVNRTLKPLINLNFGEGTYSAQSQGGDLTDIMTYARSSSASYVETYIGPLGREQQRIANDYVGSVENLALYSNDFDNAAWSKTPNIAVNKKSDGSFLLADNGNSDDYVSQSISVTPNTNNYTFTVEIKRNAGTRYTGIFAFGLGGTTRTNSITVDTLTGQITNQAAIVVGSSTYVGNGFYRYSVTLAGIIGNTSYNLRVYPAFNETGGATRNNPSTGSVFIRNAQFTQSAKPLPYVQTFDSAVTQSFTASPRIGKEGYLTEGASTNLALRSEEFDNALWNKTELSITPNAILAPDGSLSADGLVASNVTGAHQMFDGYTVTSGASITVSCFLKEAFSSKVQLLDGNSGSAARFDLAIGEVIDTTGASVLGASIEYITDGWYRCSVSCAATGTIGTPIVRLLNSSGSSSFTGDNSTIFTYAWGMQLEELPFATSYIRTEASTVTRATDGMVASTSTSNETTLAINIKQLGNKPGVVTDVLNYGVDSLNRISILTQPTNVIRFFAASAVVVTDSVILSSDSREQNKIALTSKGIINIGYINGEQVSFDDSGGYANSSNIFRVGATLTGGNPVYGHIEYAKLFDTALTAQEVKSL